MKDYVDAKFTVVRRPKRRWRIWFDWRNFLIVGGMSAATGMAGYLRMKGLL